MDSVKTMDGVCFIVLCVAHRVDRSFASTDQLVGVSLALQLQASKLRPLRFLLSVSARMLFTITIYTCGVFVCLQARKGDHDIFFKKKAIRNGATDA